MRRVGIAQALLNQPRLLLLDELSRGLDVTERENIHRLVKKYSGLTIFSTHLPEEAERIAQTVIILQNGRILYAGDIETLCAAAARQIYELRLPIEQLSRLTMPEIGYPHHPTGESLHRALPQSPISSETVSVQATLEDTSAVEPTSATNLLE